MRHAILERWERAKGQAATVYLSLYAVLAVCVFVGASLSLSVSLSVSLYLSAGFENVSKYNRKRLRCVLLNIIRCTLS